MRTVANLDRGAVRTAAGGLLWWAVPALVILTVYFSPRHVVSAETVITGLVALGLVILAARWPARSLLLLVVWLPFQGLLLSKLWSWGMPTAIVRHLGAVKEVLGLGVVIAGAANYLREGRRADALDRLALGFVALAALYVVFGGQIVPGTASSSKIRLLGFRQDAGLVLLLLGARHAPLPEGFFSRMARVVVATGAVVAGAAVFEFIDSSAWNHFVVHTMQYTRYEISILNIHPPNPNDVRFYGTLGGHKFVRSGSVFLDALSCGFYLVFPLAVTIELAIRRQLRPWIAVSMILAGAGILFTQTRSALLAAVIVALLVFRPASGRGTHWRTQLGILLAGLALIGIPAAFASGVAHRIEGATNHQDTSVGEHVSAVYHGIGVIERQPLGYGLGTGAGVGQRFTTVDVPENYYLSLGVELGVASIILFVALSVGLVRKLRSAVRQRPDPLVAAAWMTVSGLAVAALFLQVWENFSVAWPVWAAAGAALAPVALRAPDAETPSPAPEKHFASPPGALAGASPRV